MAREDIKDGLSVVRSGQGWTVIHPPSGLKAGPVVRYQRDARQMRAELLATGVDFTPAKPAEVRKHPAWKTCAKVYSSWQPRAIDLPASYGPKMTFIAQRNSDGLIHVLNLVGARLGQHHVHDDASWADWLAGDPASGISPVRSSDVIWQPRGLKDCECGREIWRRAPAKETRS